MFRKFPSLYLLILVVAGIILADQMRLPGWIFLLGCLISTLAGIAILGQKKQQTALLIFGLAFFCFSGYHYSIKYYDLPPNHISNLITEKETFQVFGSVDDWPVLRSNRTEIKVRVDSLGRVERFPVKGAIMLRISDTTTALQRGDRVEFRGRIYPLVSHDNPGSFDYARYVQHRGMFGTVYLTSLLAVRVDKSRRLGVIGLVDNLRFKISASLKRNLSPNAAALASGILIGETRDIPPEIFNRFRDSGTLHLLAVSGSNVALVLIFLILVLHPFSITRKKRAVILMVSVFVFALLSYGEPSVVRASIMALLVLLAAIVERKYDLNQTIATAALIILLFDPTQLYSVGFQLSFVAAWGLIFITPKVLIPFKPVEHKLWFKWLAVPVLISLIAQLCTAPLIAFYFGRVPAISVVANLFVVPLVSIAVVAVLLLLILDMILPSLGLFFGSILDSFMQSIFYFLKLFGEDQTVVLKTSDMSVFAVLLLYGLLFFVTLTFLNKSMRKLALAMIVVLVNIGLTFSIVSAHSNDNAQREIDLMSIPGGIAALVKWQQNSPADLVITGAYAASYPIEERILEPAFNELGVDKINQMFVLSSEYGAMDDLLRLARDYQINDIFIDHRLFNSFTDQLTLNANENNQIKLHQFFEKPKTISTPGFYPESGSLSIDFGDSEVIFLNNFSNQTKRFNRAGKPAAIILSNETGQKSIEIKEFEYEKINLLVCSKADQALKAFAINSLNCQVHDLDRQGACRIVVTENLQRPFELQRLQ